MRLQGARRRFARRARLACGAYAALRAGRPLRRSRSVLAARCAFNSFRAVRGLALSNGFCATQKAAAQESTGKENSSEGTLAHHCGHPCPGTDSNAASTDAAERPARGRRGRVQTDVSAADAVTEPAACEPAAPVPTVHAECPQALVEAAPSEAEVRSSTQTVTHSLGENILYVTSALASLIGCSR